ncbi:MAG: nickel pincer cofactor biosynthesis protein LarC [Alphaproteobacteria bacterium]|nr:nickel pincer cofactor biosynthesis protein LarC [Alphaproteobacteria bacterium]
MTKTLYLEGACGISGDMTVAALLDLGADQKKLERVLNSLHLNEFEYRISSKTSYGIRGCDFDVLLTHEHSSHEHSHEHAHSHGHEHSHEHEHGPHHPHEHRHLHDVYEIIDHAETTQNVKDLAKKIFLIVAQAESKAHGCSLEEVHFHEVGAIDSIVDILSAAVLIDDLQITDCVVTSLTEGYGTVTCQHGELPVPVPAVLNIAEASGIPLRPGEVRSEMVTPTGIAIAAALRTKETLPAQFKIIRSGIGLGKRDFGRANFLRAMIIEETLPENQVYVIECNIDDATGEELGSAMEKLMDAGAKDVHFIPCFMKKGRPAYILKIITDSQKLPEMEELVFRHTSTIGLRKYPVDRTCMQREFFTVSLPYGDVLIKKCFQGNIVRFYPEYDSVKKVSEAAGLPFRTVLDQAKAMAEKQNEL